MPRQESQVIDSVKIELTLKNGDLYHQSFVLKGAVANANTLVHNGRHFGFSRIAIDGFSVVVHFQEVSSPVDLDELLRSR